jgi:hypothetical protein
MAVALLLLPHQLQRLFLLDFNTEVIPNSMENQFRKLFSHLLDLISHNDVVHRMPTDGVPVPISLLRPYQRKPKGALCSPHYSPSLSYTKFIPKTLVLTIPTMPRSVLYLSSSLDAVIINGDLADSSHQETLHIKDYLQDMVVHRFVDVGHNVNGVHRSGTSC